MKESKQIYTMGFWTTKPGKAGEFMAAWQKFAVWTMQNQRGSVGEAKLVQDITDPNRFISFGAWAQIEYVQEWRQRPEFQAFFTEAKELRSDIRPQTLKEVITVGNSI